MAKYRTGLEHHMQLHVKLHVMPNSSDQEIPEPDPGNVEQTRWSLHPLLGALLILGGRELSIWLLAVPAICIGSAHASMAGRLGITSTLGGLHPVVTILLSRIVLDERPGNVQTIGVVLAIAGTVLATM